MNVIKNLEKYCFRVYEYTENFIETMQEEKRIGWYIEEDTITQRLNRISHKDWFNELKKEAVQKKIQASEEEILTWVDTMNYMYWTLIKIKENIRRDNTFTDLTIIQELKLPYFNKRPDYILANRNKLLIIEFSYDKQNKQEYHFENKLNQAISYKEILTSLLPTHIQIGTYTCIIKPERKDGITIEKQSKFIDEQTLQTYDDQANLALFINEFFEDNRQYDAVEELSLKLYDRKTGK